MTREIEIDLSHLTAKRVRAVLDKLREADRAAFRKARWNLPWDWKSPILRREKGATLEEMASTIGCTIDQVRHRQMQGLLALCKAFEQKSGITVKVKCYRGQL